MSTNPPAERDEAAESPVAPKRGSRVALVGGYLVTGLLFLGTTGLMWSAAVAGLVGGVVVRTIYVGIRKRKGIRPIVSPWTLLIASFFAASTLAGVRSSQQDETDAFVVSVCVDATMHSFEVLAVSERRFSRPDFQKFSDRYCQEAIDGGLMTAVGDVGSEAEFNELADSVVAAMLNAGEIHEL